MSIRGIENGHGESRDAQFSMPFEDTSTRGSQDRFSNSGTHLVITDGVKDIVHLTPAEREMYETFGQEGEIFSDTFRRLARDFHGNKSEMAAVTGIPRTTINLIQYRRKISTRELHPSRPLLGASLPLGETPAQTVERIARESRAVAKPRS